MNTFDLETAFYRRLALLSFDGRTLKPDEEFDPKHASAFRRGVVVLDRPETVGFGNGVYSRVEGFYQIDTWISREVDDALMLVKQAADAHVTHFFPANGRGLSLTENQTSAHITRRPTRRSLGRDGAFLREMTEVPFYVEIPAVG